MANTILNQQIDQSILNAVYLYMAIENQTPIQFLTEIQSLASQAAEDRFDQMINELKNRIENT